MVHGVTVVHHIPGRLRVRLPRQNRTPHLLRQLCESLEGLEGVYSFEINPVTGSILMHYQPESEGQIRNLLQLRGQALAPLSAAAELNVAPELSEVDELAAYIEKEAEFLAAHSELALNVVNAVKAIDRGIREASGNTVDLKVLLPAGLAVWAALKAGADVATPLWVTLAIFSFNSFVALHHHPVAVPVAGPAAVFSGK